LLKAAIDHQELYQRFLDQKALAKTSLSADPAFALDDVYDGLIQLLQSPDDDSSQPPKSHGPQIQ
jgi:hypothetical protein